MRVVASVLVPWETPTVQAVGAVRARQSYRAGTVLLLQDETGRTGQGEASPLPGYSPDSLADCTAALRDVHHVLPTAIDPCDPLAGTLGLCRATPAARFALETALLDLAGQHRGIPLSVCLGGRAEVAPLALHALVGAATDDDIVSRALVCVALGHRTLKVKVGGDFDRERAALMHLRAAVGTTVALRLDANGAWLPREVHAHLAALQSLSPEFVEQPVAGAAVLSLGDCALPWAADECLTDPSVADVLLAPGGAGRCVAVVIKPFLLGGLVAARTLALRALSVGLGVVVTHGFDGPVGISAACALALSLPSPPWACGLGPHPALRATVPYVTGCTVTSVNAPGLGLAPVGRVSGS